MVNRFPWALWMLFCLVEPSPAEPTGSPRIVAIKIVKPEEYRAQLSRARELVNACKVDGKLCDAGAIGDDDHVMDSKFDVHWGWLRDAMDGAKKAKPEDRKKVLEEVAARLEEQSREAGLEPQGNAGLGVEFSKARETADEVLTRGEFRSVTETAYTQRVMARLTGWLQRFFSGGSGLGRYAVWIGAVLEWGFVLVAGVGALLWTQRMMRQQRLAIALDGSAVVREWDEVSRRWADAARDAATRGDWRESVHSLYWASVVELEGRRVWRQNRGRTPREYLRLLEPDSPYYRPVQTLTQSLERIWYGLGEAGRSDYDHALALYEELRAA